MVARILENLIKCIEGSGTIFSSLFVKENSLRKAGEATPDIWKIKMLSLLLYTSIKITWLTENDADLPHLNDSNVHCWLQWSVFWLSVHNWL